MRQWMKEMTETRVRYGFARIHILLRREGWRDNHKRTYGIYKEEGLNLRAPDSLTTTRLEAQRVFPKVQPRITAQRGNFKI